MASCKFKARLADNLACIWCLCTRFLFLSFQFLGEITCSQYVVCCVQPCCGEHKLMSDVFAARNSKVSDVVLYTFQFRCNSWFVIDRKDRSQRTSSCYFDCCFMYIVLRSIFTVETRARNQFVLRRHCSRNSILI